MSKLDQLASALQDTSKNPPTTAARARIAAPRPLMSPRTSTGAQRRVVRQSVQTETGARNRVVATMINTARIELVAQVRGLIRL